MDIRIATITRFPVKGLSAEHLDHVDLTAGGGLPHDRRFAIVHGASTFDLSEPAWRPKSNFLMLAKNERLAQLETAFDPTMGVLTIRRGGRQVARGQITTPMGRLLIDQFFAAFMAGEAPGMPHILEAPGHMLSDAPEKYVSIINRASVDDLERVVHVPVNPVRFRGNLLLEGPEPWEEAHWIGRGITIGDAHLTVERPISRCAATNVDPVTGARDLNIPQAMQRGYGHINCGVYARVDRAGPVAVGDRAVLDPLP